MNIKTFFSIAILSAVAIAASAATVEPSVTIVAVENSGTYKVVYKSAAIGRVHVAIINSNNEVVFSEAFNKMSGFVRPYNFEGLPSGEYTIEVKDGQGKKVEKVSYKMSGAENLVKSLMKITKVNTSQTKYMLTVGNKGLNIIHVAILDGDGNLVFDESHVVEGDFGVVYNMVKPGVYTFIVTDKFGNNEMFMN